MTTPRSSTAKNVRKQSKTRGPKPSRAPAISIGDNGPTIADEDADRMVMAGALDDDVPYGGEDGEP
jgi:hypothetical protein